MNPEKVEFDDITLDRWDSSNTVQPNIILPPTDEDDEEEFNENFENPGMQKDTYVDRILRLVRAS